MELSGKTVYGPVLKTTQFSAHAQNHASPERCRKSFTVSFLGDHDIPLTGSNFGNLTALRAIFSHIFTAHAYLRGKRHLDPSSRLATTDIGRKSGGCCAPFGEGELGPHI